MGQAASVLHQKRLSEGRKVQLVFIVAWGGSRVQPFL